ncbi:hypothetical protein DY000_02027539 [Brassica cretica]|uniref:Secreted protein n=1 Tax=Brassica cretica TaxID=69181 RepID=A0ABQ7E3M5_BRACR|nr:hypothetical protein DY000_02027539 [Brassica cretica]
MVSFSFGAAYSVFCSSITPTVGLDEISILIDEALQSSVVCVVTAESPKPSITVGGGFSVDVVKFPVVFRWSNDLVCSGLSMKTVEARVPV